MLAVVVNEINKLSSIEVREIEPPQPESNQVLIESVAAALNFPDLLQIRGKYQIVPATPFVPGKEAAGVVIAVGTDVEHIQPGNRVLVEVDYGAFAEQVTADAQRTFLLPDEIEMPTAVAMGLVYQTAYIALTERAALRAGETVLVTGASGGIGLASVQLAKAFGATVLAATSDPTKFDAVRYAGADHVIDLSMAPLNDKLRDQVYAVTGGKGVNVVLDVVGGQAFDASLRSLAFGGRIVVLGFTSAEIPNIKSNYLLLKNIAAVGMTINGYFAKQPEIVNAAQVEIINLWRQGKIRPNIHAELSLHEFANAFEMLENREVVGKVVLSLG
ncbi:MAG TPA: NADPH:quinone oxidoreductase family protein [Arenicellales bacterium]|jgi:NADPH2:quinone reductase|nr:NADPH:quinone oxidoreductase family protein [Arenicellales bacterium]HJM03572.1 NADPH:quinone oxidoreductase family protein [Arenicellales bacterium]|tara:strand:+ start:56 stop:1045 length:990 start_codon:yes stop_codon:yes gene_type:complete